MGRDIVAGWMDCQCQGAREAREREEAERERERRAQAEADLLARCRRAGVRRRYEGAEHPDASRLADALEAGSGAYVCGPVGTGKTWLASATVRELVRRGVPCRMVGTADALERIRESYDGGPDPTEAWRETRVLVLDDLGKGAPTQWALERMFLLLDGRYSDMLPTMVTTQYGPSDLIRRLGSRGDPDTAQAIVSRLRQGCETVRTSGRDRRLS